MQAVLDQCFIFFSCGTQTVELVITSRYLRKVAPSLKQNMSTVVNLFPDFRGKVDACHLDMCPK